MYSEPTVTFYSVCELHGKSICHVLICGRKRGGPVSKFLDGTNSLKARPKREYDGKV
jgi:hypothetical protein